MKYSRLFDLNAMSLCCVLGLLAKKLINPAANLLTDALHIPGGVSTGFSIMFLVIAAELVKTPHNGAKMGAAQGLLALALGRVGSMGILSPIGYILPGFTIDLVYRLPCSRKISCAARMMSANGLAAVAASAAANLIVFHLRGPALWLYFSVSATSGALFGLIGSTIAARLRPAMDQHRNKAR